MRLFNLTLLFVTLFSTALTIDWQQWLTREGSTSQGVLTLTAGFALYSPYVVQNVYGNCWKNQDGGRVFIYSFQCAKAVGRAIAEIAVGLKGLGYATGWYKRDEISIVEEDMTDFFGNSAIYVNVSRQLDYNSLSEIAVRGAMKS